MDVNNPLPRLFVTLIGDVKSEPFAQVKYGYLLRALEQKYSITTVDATLRGITRVYNALQVFTLDRKVWKERFYQNVPAFKLRSEKIARALKKQSSRVDLIFQIGVLYDACWENPNIPRVIYTDYTSILSSRKPDLGRSPQRANELGEWIALEKQAFQQSAHIFTRSDYVRDSVINDYQIPAGQVTAVGGGVNIDPLPEISPHQGTTPPTALFIGKDFYRKGGDILLRAFAEIRRQMPEARLLMVTDGPIPEGLELNNVEIIPPTWDRSVILSLYRQADCFVLPSRLETWGDVLLEAMSYGLPCIGVTGEGMSDIIEDQSTGLLIPPEDEGALSGALLQILSDSELRHQFSKAARQRVECQFTWDQVVARISPIMQMISKGQQI
jgi:glycosyltransferase involved in cell wall biosynthesis